MDTKDAMGWLHDDLTRISGEVSGVREDVGVLGAQVKGLDMRVTAHLREHGETRKTFRNHAVGLFFRLILVGLIAAGGALVAIASTQKEKEKNNESYLINSSERRRL